MAIKKASLESPKIFFGDTEPNAARVNPTKVGDLFFLIHSGAGSAGLYFCKSMSAAAANRWGTAGTG